jgi:two-component system chemotaxis sensor kinase CheA
MKTKLLLVDDDTSVITALTDALESEDFDVRHALDGQDALVVFHTHPDIELVLMDLNMPGRDGWDALRLIHTFDPRLPVIIITGQPNQLHAAREAGAAALLEKPIEIPELLTTVNAVLSGKRLQKVIGELCRV